MAARVHGRLAAGPGAAAPSPKPRSRYPPWLGNRTVLRSPARSHLADLRRWRFFLVSISRTPWRSFSRRSQIWSLISISSRASSRKRLYSATCCFDCSTAGPEGILWATVLPSTVRVKSQLGPCPRDPDLAQWQVGFPHFPYVSLRDPGRISPILARAALRSAPFTSSCSSEVADMREPPSCSCTTTRNIKRIPPIPILRQIPQWCLTPTFTRPLGVAVLELIQ